MLFEIIGFISLVVLGYFLLDKRYDDWWYGKELNYVIHGRNSRLEKEEKTGDWTL